MNKSVEGRSRGRWNAKRRGLLGHALNRVSRYTEILGIFLRFGYSDLVRKVDVDVYRRLRGRSRHTRRSWSRPERMRRTLEELGPAFVKIGQIMSHRPDLLPPDWIKEFEKLRSQIPPADFGEIRQVIEEELGGTIETVFQNFDSYPMASASIGQVHRAALLDGTEVVVKIQRPGIRRIVETDLAILKDIIRLAQHYLSALAPFHLLDAVLELERAFLLELDFRNEADNLDRFRRNFTDDAMVDAPEPFRQYSSRRILTMGRVEGIPAGSPDLLKGEDVNLSEIAQRGADAVLKQIFEHRFFHSDPHGDNILITPDGGIVFLDFGQVGSVLPSQRQFLASLLSALIRFDAVRAVRAILSWSGYRDPDVFRKLTMDMEFIIERYLSRSFGLINIGEMVTAMVNMVRRYEIEIPSNFYLLAKAMATIEDIASSLNPNFDFIRASRPFVRRMIRREFQPDRLTEQLSGVSEDVLHLLRDFPGEARDIMSLLKAGRMRMEFELRDAVVLNETIKKMITRLSAAILLSAMIMGASLLVQSHIPPLFLGIPVIGILGFIFAGLIGIVFLVDLWRHRR